MGGALGEQLSWTGTSAGLGVTLPDLCAGQCPSVSPRTVVLVAHTMLVALPKLRAAHPGSFGEKRPFHLISASTSHGCWSRSLVVLGFGAGTEVAAGFLGGVRYCR